VWFRWIPWTLVAVLCVALGITWLRLHLVSEKNRLLDERNQLVQKKTETQLTELKGEQADYVARLEAANERLNKENTRFIREADMWREEMDSQKIKLLALDHAVTEQSARLELLLDPATAIVPLAEPKGETRASGRVFWHGGTKKGLVAVFHLDPVLKGKGQSLMLWTFCGNKPPAATALFWTDVKGQGLVPITIPADLTCVDKFAVTVEATDSEWFAAPKGPIVLLGK
jgi:anti-sigma-K factor RskA